MQQSVILVLATMLAIVAVVLVLLLWRAYRRSAWRQRWQAIGTMGWTRSSSRSSDPPVAPPAHPPEPVLPLSGKDESTGRTLRATLCGGGTATAADGGHLFCAVTLPARPFQTSKSSATPPGR